MRYPIVAPLVAAAAVLTLAACANPRVQQAAYARSALVGLPESTLLSCAGVPDRSRTAGGQTFLTYEVATIDAYYRPSFGFFGSSFHHHHSPLGYGFGLPLDTAISSDYCEATFTLQDGQVAQLVYNTPTGYRGGGIAECYDIVQNCMGYVPPAPVQ